MKIPKLLLTAALCTALAAVGCSSSEKDPQAYYQKALQHIEKNEAEAAILELRSAIQADARFADARYRLGLLYLENNEPQKAFGELLRAAELDPENIDAAVKVAQFYLVGKKGEESRKFLDQVLSREPLNREALVLLTNLEMAENNFDTALETLAKLGDEVQTSDELQNIRGRIFFAQQEWQTAESAFRQAIALGRDNIVNYFTLLKFYEDRQDKEKAKLLLDEMIVKFPDDAQVRLLLAGYHRAVGEVANTEEALLDALEIAPSSPRLRLQLAGFYRDNGKIDQAEAVLVQAHADFVDNPDISVTLANLYFDQGKIDQVEELLGKVAADNPGASLLRARLLQREGKMRESVEPLKKLAGDFPNWGDPSFFLGVAHYTLRELDLAKFAVGEAIQKKKNDARYHTLLGQVHLEQGAFEDAEKEALTSLQLNSKNVQAALLLSRALLGQKKFDRALEVLTDIDRQLPNNPEVLTGLAQAAYGAGKEEQGAEVVDKLLAVDPGNIQAIGMTLATRYRDDLAGGQAFLEQQLSTSPENFRLYLLYGGLLERRDQPDKALAAYEKAQELGENDVRAYFAAARLLGRLGKSADAMAKYQAMVERQPNSIPGHMGIAALLEAEGDTTGAMARYDRVLAIKADFAPAANNLAWLITQDPEGDLGKALMLAMTARQVMPDDANIADTLGYVHLRRESYRLALAQFEEALKRRPDDPQITFHYAQALYGDGQQAKGVETLHALLATETPFPGRQEAQALLAQWQ